MNGHFFWIRSLLLGSLLTLLMPAKAQFTERADAVHVYNKYTASTYIGGGVALIDVNNDSRLDIFLTGGINPDRLYINAGDEFDRNVLYVGPEDFDFLDYETIGAAVGDVNNDGYDDIYVCTAREYPSLLMINKGDETFDILTPEESGIQDYDWGVSAAFGDVNQDGLLDIFATNYVDTIKSSVDSMGNTIFDHVGFNNYLYINQGGNTFLEMAEAYGVQQKGTTLSAAFTDYDADRDVDLYVINDFGHFIIPNELYQNHYPASQFEDRSVASGADIAIFGMGVAVGDYDGDLDLDYYITNIGRNVLISNNGDGSFEEVTNLAGVQDSVDSSGGRLVGWGTGFFDYDNDGWQDLYISNGHIPAGMDIINPQYNVNSLYRNNGDGSFENVGRDLGLADPAGCRGSAYGDLDNDGDLDLIFVPVNTIPHFLPVELNPIVMLYYNEIENEHNWVKVKLEGVESNRNGYGAHLYLYDNSGHAQLREADGGSSHASSNTPFIHFGLGDVEAIDSLVVLWPSGTRQVVYQPEINRLHIIQEGGNIAPPVAVQEALQAALRVYPNPATTHIVVDLDQTMEYHYMPDYDVRDVLGSIVKQGCLGAGISHIELDQLPIGTYALTLHFSEGFLLKRTFVKH